MRLKELRKKKGLSLKELGDILGVAESTVSLYENQKREASYLILQKVAAYFDVSIDYLIGNSDEIKQTGADSYLIHIPILEAVSLSENALDFHYSPENETIDLGNPDNFFYYKMHGDSMSPHIENGDIALIKKQSTIESGEVAAVIYGDNPVMLRRVIKNSDITVLQPFNPQHQSIFISSSENLIILGKLTETIKKW